MNTPYINDSTSSAYKTSFFSFQDASQCDDYKWMNMQKADEGSEQRLLVQLKNITRYKMSMLDMKLTKAKVLQNDNWM